MGEELYQSNTKQKGETIKAFNRKGTMQTERTAV